MNHNLSTLKTLLFFIIFISISYTTLAQEDSLLTQKYRLAFKFAPLTFLDPLYPAAQFGAEIRLHPNWSWQSEFGYILKESALEWGDSTDFANNRKGFKIRGEIRFYLKNTSSKTFRKIGLMGSSNPYNLQGGYLAAEFFYSKVQSTEHKTFVEQDTIFCTETFQENRQVAGLHLKMGHQAVFKSGLLIDFFMGLGAKYLDVQHPDRQCGGRIDSYPDCILCYIHDERTRVLPNLTLGFKFGYAF